MSMTETPAARNAQQRYLIHTTSKYSTPDDDFEAHAYCECGWVGPRHYSRIEGTAIMQAEDDASTHVGFTCRLDESGLYKAQPSTHASHEHVDDGRGRCRICGDHLVPLYPGDQVWPS